MDFYSPNGLCNLIKLTERYAKHKIEGAITFDTAVENCNKMIVNNLDTIQETLFQAIYMPPMTILRDDWESTTEIK
jgi:hypothetical protein